MTDFVRVDNKNNQIAYINRELITNIVYDPETDKTFVWMVGDKDTEYTEYFGDITGQIISDTHDRHITRKICDLFDEYAGCRNGLDRVRFCNRVFDIIHGK